MVIKRFLKSTKGQALVETALILPMLLIILMGIIEFGRIFNAYLIITNASREGARYGAVHTSDTQIYNTIKNLTSTLDNSKVFVSILPSDINRTNGSPVTVKVDYDLDIITPFISTIVPDPFRITSKTIMRVE